MYARGLVRARNHEKMRRATLNKVAGPQTDLPSASPQGRPQTVAHHPIPAAYGRWTAQRRGCLPTVMARRLNAWRARRPHVSYLGRVVLASRGPRPSPSIAACVDGRPAP